MATGQYQTASPWRFPIFRLLGIVFAVASSYAVLMVWRSTHSTVEDFYLKTYAKLSVTPNLGGAHYSVGQSMNLGQTFQVMSVGGVAATTANTPRPGVVTVQTAQMDAKAFHAWLRTNVYGGLSFARFAQTPLYAAMTLVVLFYAMGSVLDSRRVRHERKGVTLRGPGITSPRQFNRKIKAQEVARESETTGAGLCLELESQQSWLFKKLRPRREFVQIARDRESHHIQIAGDTGSGKSATIRQILYQIEARGELAIVFDPDRQYIKEFLHEERKDWVLNPKDERCPF